MVGALLSLLLYVVVVGLIVWLALYVLDQFPIAEPFNRIARIIIIVLAVLIIILMLLSLADTGPLRFPRF
jgi:hypothetical protein